MSGIVTIDGLTSKQTYNVYVIAYDNAGNASLKSDTTPVTTRGKLLAPNITPSGSKDGSGNYNTDVTISITDKAGTGTIATSIKYTINGGADTIYTGSFNITTDGTYEIKAWTEDSTGGKSTMTTVNFTRLTNTAPTMQSLEFLNKTTNSITVTARATDSKSDNLTYQLYVKTGNLDWTASGSPKSATSGEQVTLTAEGLKEYTYYLVKAIVVNTELSTSQTSELLLTTPIITYCSGQGIICELEGRLQFLPKNAESQFSEMNTIVGNLNITMKNRE